MRKRIYVSIIMLLLCCIFTLPVFATSTIISIDICEIKIVCDNFYGTFSVDGKEYNSSQSFMRRKGGSINLKITPDNRHKIDSITVETENSIFLGEDSVLIENIESDATINVKFSLLSGGKKEDEGSSDKLCDGIHNCISKPFEDVDTQKWYHHDVDYVIKEGLMLGTGNNEFEPHGSTTRAMIVTVLHRLENKPTSTNANIFDDVAKDMWYTDSINWANSVGVVLGYGDGNFGPNDPITREQMVAILYRYTKYKKGTINMKYDPKFYQFEDVDDVSTYAYTPMKWACSQGIIVGDNNRLKPQGVSERCQIAAMLHRFCMTIIK